MTTDIGKIEGLSIGVLSEKLSDTSHDIDEITDSTISDYSLDIERDVNGAKTEQRLTNLEEG